MAERTIAKRGTARKAQSRCPEVGIGILEETLFLLIGEIRRFANEFKSLLLLADIGCG